MQSAYDVEFRGTFGDAFRCARPDFFKGEGVSTRRIGIAAKGTEFAVRAADIRRIDVPVDVVVADIAVTLLADVIREPADGQEIVRFEKPQAFLSVEALAGENFISNWPEAGVCELEFGGHFRWFCASRVRHERRSAPEKQE